MYENSCCFEPTFTLNGIPILPGRCQALIAQGKAEAPVAVTHLALARSQKMGGGILGDTKDKETIRKGCLFIFCKKTAWERDNQRERRDSNRERRARQQ